MISFLTTVIPFLAGISWAGVTLDRLRGEKSFLLQGVISLGFITLGFLQLLTN